MTHHDDVRTLYTASAARLVAQMYAITADFAEAQDAVHEAFVRALARPGEFAQLGNPEAWLRTVALNVVRGTRRTRAVLDRRHSVICSWPYGPPSSPTSTLSSCAWPGVADAAGHS